MMYALLRYPNSHSSTSYSEITYGWRSFSRSFSADITIINNESHDFGKVYVKEDPREELTLSLEIPVSSSVILSAAQSPVSRKRMSI
jgi:hypothetical protein